MYFFKTNGVLSCIISMPELEYVFISKTNGVLSCMISMPRTEFVYIFPPTAYDLYT